MTSYFSENQDAVIGCSESPQASLREKASKVNHLSTRQTLFMLVFPVSLRDFLYKVVLVVSFSFFPFLMGKGHIRVNSSILLNPALDVKVFIIS